MKRLAGLGIPCVVVFFLLAVAFSPVATASTSIENGSYGTFEGKGSRTADRPFESLLLGDSPQPLLTPPLILGCTALPDPQVVGNPVNISCLIMDDIAVVAAWVEVTDPFGQIVGNFSMLYDPGIMQWYNETIYYKAGAYRYTVTAKDQEGNFAWSDDLSFVFTMTDNTPPTISNQTAIPSPQEIGQNVNITCDVSDDGAITLVKVEVWDPNGLSVGNFTMSYDPGTGKWYLEQPYTDIGTYTYVIYAEDTGGNFDTASGGFDMIDTTPPTISDVQENPSPQEVLKNVNVSAVITDLDSVNEVWIDITDPDSLPVGNFSMSYDAVNGRYFYNNSYGKIGDYNYVIWAKDPSGNWNSFSGSFTMLPDVTPPVITAVAATPSPQEIYFNVNITCNVTDNIAVYGAWIEIRDPQNALIGNFSMSFDPGTGLYYYERMYDMLGDWSFTIWANDTSDLWTFSSGSFIIQDKTPPVIDQIIAFPNPQEVFLLVNVSGRVTDNVSPFGAWIEIRDPLGALVGNFTMLYDSGTGRWSHTQSYNLLGTYTFTIWANDTSDNWAFNTGSFVIHDTTPPVITGHSAVPDPQESNSTVNISCTVSDNYRFFGAWVEVQDPFSVYLGNFTMLWDGVSSRFYYEQTYWQIGTHDYRIWVNDTSNNWDFAVGSFAIQDTTDPIISNIQRIPQPQEVHFAVNVSARVTDNYGVKRVVIDLLDPFGGSVGTFDMSYDIASGRYYYRQNYDEVGSYTCNIWANDYMNNQVTANCNFFIVDTTPPMIINLTEVPDPAEVNTPVNVSAIVTDNYQVQEVWISIRDPTGNPVGNFSMSFHSTTGRYYYTQIYTMIGLYPYVIWASDTSGNWERAQGSFRMRDTTPPTITAVTEVPDPQEVYGFVNVSAEVTDNYKLDIAKLEIRNPIGGLVGNFTMSLDPGTGRYFHVDSYDMLGTYRTIISAKDTRFNWGVEFGDFLIQDTTPPRIQNTVAVPPVQDSGGNVRIETQVTDNYDAFPNIAVALEVFDPFSASMFNISMSYDSIGGVYYYERAYSELGFYDFIITAKDRNDNYATDSSTFEIQDMTPPTIGAPVETPDPQEVYGKVNVSVDVTDNYRVQSVSIDIYDPSGGSVGNFSMVYDPGSDRYSYESGYDMLGSYTCVIWAFDTSSNFDSVGCGFLIQDSTKPTIENATAEPLPQNIGREVNISANAYDNFLLLGVYIRIWDPASNYLGNFSMDFDASSGRYYFATVYNVVGTYDFKIDAVDSSSNWASTPGTFIIEDMVPPEISNVIAVPTPQEVGLNVEISARITDNEGVIASATVEVRDPSLTVLGNFSMSFVGLDKYSFSRAYDLMLGRYNFTIWASDSNDNWASATGFFDIEDTTPPTINITPVPPVEIEDGVIIILATIGDNFYDSSDLQVWINISYPNGTPFQIDVVMDYDPVSDEFSYQNSFNVILGDYPFDICASDSSGNLNCEQGSFRIQDTQPPVASAGGDQTVDQGDSVSFNGTGTYDNDPLFEETGNYSWTFEDQGTVTLYGKSPSYTFTVGGDYVVTLKARDRSGNLGTDTVLIHVNPGPNPPINIQISDPTEDSLKLTWEPPSTYTDGTTLLEPDIQRYTIYRSNSSDGEYVQIADGITTTEYVDTGLSNNTTYYYKITCWANNIESEKSDWRLGTTLPPMPPPEPGEPLSLNMTLLLLVLTLIIVVVVVAVIAAVLLKRKKRPPEEEIYLPEAYGEAYVEEGYPPPPPPR